MMHTEVETIKFCFLLVYNFLIILDVSELLKEELSSSIFELCKHIKHSLIEVC